MPGTKAGGPISSISNLIDYISKNGNEIKLLTRNKDWSENVPYKEIQSNVWFVRKNYKIFYFSSYLNYYLELRKIKSEEKIILNSFFSRLTIIYFFLLPKSILRQHEILFYTRGELNNHGISNKLIIKTLYIYIYKIRVKGLEIKYLSTSEKEKNDVYKILNVSPSIAPNINKPSSKSEKIELQKPLKLVFVGRIDPMKGLIQFVSHIPKNVKLIFDIIGPINDLNYYNEFLNAINNLNKEKQKVNLLGYMNWFELEIKIKEYDFIVLPSFSENYGHAIYEGIAAGLLPITSTGIPISKKLITNECGFIFSHDNIKKDLESIFKNIQELDIKSFNVMSDKNISIIESEQFQIKNTIDNIYGLYKGTT